MIIAIIIVAALLAVSTFYVTKAGGESVSKLQTIRIGADVLALLDYDGTLDTLSVGSIEIGLNTLLPINYHMRIEADCIGQGPIIVETIDTSPQDRFIGGGKRVFVTNTSKYCIAGYSIWLK
jgi:hypothetical protein